MSEGSISQEEIDALLSGVDMGGLTSGGTSSIVPEANIDIPTLQNFVSSTKDKFAEVIKNMTEKDASVSSADVEVSDRDVFMSRLPEELIAVMADYSTGLIGDHLFVMSNELATKLVGLINKEDNPALDDMGLSVLSEVISSMSGSEITELSKGGKLPGLVTNPPEAVSQPKAMVRMPQNKFALITFQLKLDGQDYTLWEAVGGSVAEGMARALGGGAAASPAGGMGASPVFTGGFAGGTAAGAAASPMGGMGMMTGAGMQQPMMGMQQHLQLFLRQNHL
ncbi:flagellar motor switch protein FliN [Treponema sp.]|uniref:flagellar motor switch protein FliN n=1 Tax=Treponema sp. TaxID=166 RepID=UPI0025FDBCF9|nr:flagellar motor switch protein FliN [Treponema sp.]MCR5218742.1 flagellar motor switch protein FliN [Treponema sp.]